MPGVIQAQSGGSGFLGKLIPIALAGMTGGASAAAGMAGQQLAGMFAGGGGDGGGTMMSSAGTNPNGLPPIHGSIGQQEEKKPFLQMLLDGYLRGQQR